MAKTLIYLAQIPVYFVIAILLGFFSSEPEYNAAATGGSQLLLSVSHIGQPISPCRKLTPSEIESLAANMRRTEICPRERLPLFVQIELSGELVYDEVLPPSGLSGDGSAQAYRRITIEPGNYHLSARLRDSNRVEGFDFEQSDEVTLKAGEIFVIDFRSELGGFIFDAGRSQKWH